LTGRRSERGVLDGLLAVVRAGESRALVMHGEPGWARPLVFTTRTGRPIEPRNLVRSFRRICEANNVRLIKVHHIRHTVASLLKALGVPARDAQVILGHSRMAVTLEIYTQTDDEAQLDALTRLHDLFDRPEWLPLAPRCYMN
jgi:integrase